jgi:hypothetical protein
MGENQVVPIIIMHSVASFDHCLAHFSGSFDHLGMRKKKQKKIPALCVGRGLQASGSHIQGKYFMVGS